MAKATPQRFVELHGADSIACCIVQLTGDCLLIAPPFACEDQHIDEIFTKIRGVLAKQ